MFGNGIEIDQRVFCILKRNASEVAGSSRIKYKITSLLFTRVFVRRFHYHRSINPQNVRIVGLTCLYLLLVPRIDLVHRCCLPKQESLEDYLQDRGLCRKKQGFDNFCSCLGVIVRKKADVLKFHVLIAIVMIEGFSVFLILITYFLKVETIFFL